MLITANQSLAIAPDLTITHTPSFCFIFPLLVFFHLPPLLSCSLFQSCLTCSCKTKTVLTWHWICSARPSIAAGGPLGSFGVRVCWLWSAVLQPVCSFGIQTWSSPPKRGASGESVVQHSLLFNPFIPPTRFSRFSFFLPWLLSLPLLSWFPSLLTRWCIHKHTDSGYRPQAKT